MTEFDRQRIAKWIGDAFAILCVRSPGAAAAERNVRLGFEAVLRELRTPPLRLIARSVPPAGRAVPASTADWRQILHALDQCRAIFARYEGTLGAAERRTRDLVEATHRFAADEFFAKARRKENVAARSTAGAAAPEPTPAAMVAAVAESA